MALVHPGIRNTFCGNKGNHLSLNIDILLGAEKQAWLSEIFFGVWDGYVKGRLLLSPFFISGFSIPFFFF